MPAQGKRRALGQHFLRDKSLARSIVDRALELFSERGCQSILEIGPGRGALTEPLLERTDGRGIPLVFSERDRELAESWQKRRVGIVLAGDFLDAPESEWLSQAPLLVISNLPYSAGTAILTRLARHSERVGAMVLMFQAEVARRLRAESESKAWGSLSIWIQNRWNVRKLWSVPPGAFSPPPEVDSEVVELIPRSEPRVAVSNERETEWEQLLKAAFAYRRKMLRSGLPPRYRNALERAGLDGTKRAEALTWDEWKRFFEKI